MRITVSLLVAVCFLSFQGCKPVLTPAAVVTKVSRAASKPIRIGSNFWPGLYWTNIADKEGWFKEAGLNVETVDTNADYFKSLDDVVNGKLDATGFTVFDFILYNARGKDLVGVVVTDMSYGADAMVVAPGIKSLHDLEGKKIGLPKGTYLEFMFDIIVVREAMKLSDFRIVDIHAEVADKELAQGHVSAVVTWEPVATAAAQASHGTKLFTTADFPGVSGGIWAFRREFVENRPDDVQRIVNTWNRSIEFTKAKPNEAWAVVAAANKQPIKVVRDFTTLDKILDRQDDLLSFSYSAGFESIHGAWRQMNDFMLDHGLVSKRLDSSHFLDPRFVQRIP